MSPPAANGPIYLDYAATTPVDALVAEQMARTLTQDGNFGNPGSTSHLYGERAAAAVEQARSQVAAAIGAEPKDIIWTSGATEANNLAIFGVAQYYRAQKHVPAQKNHIVTMLTEHKAVLDPCRELQRRGWMVSYLVPASDGRLAAAALSECLREDTVLASVMYVNNETGVVQDIAALAAVCRQRGVPLHVDAAQSIGKCALDVRSAGIALASFSAHKVYGPKGVGALYIDPASNLQLQALHFGGGQERGLRSGTLPTHQVVGMGAAFERANTLFADESTRITALSERLWGGLAAIGGVLRNGDAGHCVPHILNASFEGVEGESLLASVQERIAVSTGSACMSATAEPSYVLRALGRNDRLAEASLRFSLGRFTSPADIDAAIEAVTAAVHRLRRMAGTEAKGMPPAAGPP